MHWSTALAKKLWHRSPKLPLLGCWQWLLLAGIEQPPLTPSPLLLLLLFRSGSNPQPDTAHGASRVPCHQARGFQPALSGQLATTENHWQSLAISGSHWQSLAVTENHWQSPAVTGNNWQPLKTAGNQWQSLAISGNQWQPQAITDNHWQPLAITYITTTGNHWQLLATTDNH